VSLRIDWTPGAQRDLGRLDRPTRARIVAAVLKLAESSQGDVVKLAGSSLPNIGCASAAGVFASRGIKPPVSSSSCASSSWRGKCAAWRTGETRSGRGVTGRSR